MYRSEISVRVSQSSVIQPQTSTPARWSSTSSTTRPRIQETILTMRRLFGGRSTVTTASDITSLRGSQLWLGSDVVTALLVGGRDDDRAEERQAERRARYDGVPRRLPVEALQQHERAEHHAHDRVRDRDRRHRRHELPRRERELLEQEPDDPGGRPDPELEAC